MTTKVSKNLIADAVHAVLANHILVPKLIVTFNVSDGSIVSQDGEITASIDNPSTGVYDITFSDNFSDTNYYVLPMAEMNDPSFFPLCIVDASTRSVGGVTVNRGELLKSGEWYHGIGETGGGTCTLAFYGDLA